MHKFKDEIIDWLNGGKYEFQVDEKIWLNVTCVGHFDYTNIRKVEKPKPKTKKMVQWLFNDGENYFSLNIYYDLGVTPQDVFGTKPIKPLPHTEIEVED
jgi:hypothetical protein